MWFVQHNNFGKVEQVLNLDFVEAPNSRGFETDFIPNPEIIKGKEAIMYVDESTKSIYFKYEDRPLTQEEKYEELEKKQSLMQAALDEMIFGL